MIYWKLFVTFFEIGLFTFGGGYAMISLIHEKTLALGWLTEEELLNTFINIRMCKISGLFFADHRQMTVCIAYSSIDPCW